MTDARPSSESGHALARSNAFREASLRSETQRAYVVMTTALLLIGLALTSGVGHDVNPAIRVAALTGVGCLFALQAGVLLFARWASKNDRAIPTWFIVSTVIFESLIPAAMMFWNIQKQTLPPYTSLFSPPILACGLLICLTTLRLRPGLCILSGLTCAISFAAVLAYVTVGLGLSPPASGLPYAAYVNASLFMVITGLGAAWVAREIRRHLEAALGEAETRHQMARMEHDLSIAQDIQRALLPRAAPDIPGFDVAGWNRSADQTGGDYYDWQSLPDGNWMITLADVSGHGIGPALVTAACRAYVRASSFYNADLSSLTSRMNRLLAADLPEGRFVTMVSVVIDRTGGPLQLLSAGHGPIVLYVGATSSVDVIIPHDPPLAIDSDTQFGPAQPITLAPGDFLALVTDGFVEWSRPGDGDRREQFGISRLSDSLRAHAKLPAQSMIEAVAADVGAFAAGEPQQDDLTMVIIKRAT